MMFFDPTRSAIFPIVEMVEPTECSQILVAIDFCHQQQTSYRYGLNWSMDAPNSDAPNSIEESASVLVRMRQRRFGMGSSKSKMATDETNIPAEMSADGAPNDPLDKATEETAKKNLFEEASATGDNPKRAPGSSFPETSPPSPVSGTGAGDQEQTSKLPALPYDTLFSGQSSTPAKCSDQTTTTVTPPDDENQDGSDETEELDHDDDGGYESGEEMDTEKEDTKEKVSCSSQ